jgi:hypothetical protein
MYACICLNAWIECVIGLPSMKTEYEFVCGISHMDDHKFPSEKDDVKTQINE